MAKTANAYSSSQGEVEVTISSANVTAIAAFTTAQAIVLDGVVRSFRRTNNPERAQEDTNVTGSVTPITLVSHTLPGETWELIIVDDHFIGAAGEWGTDALTGYEIFRELLNARQDPGALKCTPAGSGATNVEIALVNPRVKAVGLPGVDADSARAEEIVITLAADSHTTAAHG